MDFPIRNGIPEFTPNAYVQSFSYQWHAIKTTPSLKTFSTDTKSSFIRTIGRTPSQFSGKKVLDAGCGRGVLLELLSKNDAKVIGIDMSDGISVAASKAKKERQAHVVRGDILQPPFPDESFDAIFSLGVLHHTSDCKGSVLRLARLLRPGGFMAIWVYSSYSRYRNACSDALRHVTTRMPHSILFALCHLAVPMKWIQRIPILGLPFRVIPIAAEGPWQSVVLGTFDWYSPKFQSKHTFPEVFEWFEEAELEQIRVHDWGIAVSGYAPQKKEPSPAQS
ncbi:MAG: class I SAM-dependent methyltransferase [Acidobacteriota bacterium]|nr:class I SAM-dependent methyltransferase [Acidobacteriota bacterium]